MELINGWVTLKILQLTAYAGEIIFQMLSGPTPLQRLRATHIASIHRGLGAQRLSICIFKLPPYSRGFTLATAVSLHRS